MAFAQFSLKDYKLMLNINKNIQQRKSLLSFINKILLHHASIKLKACNCMVVGTLNAKFSFQEKNKHIFAEKKNVNYFSARILQTLQKQISGLRM